MGRTMTDATIKLTVPPEKRKEILQTLRAILGQIRREQGCISCNCYVDIEAENTIYFKEEWKTGEDLVTHLRSVHFKVLIGAMKLLNKEPDIRFNTIASTAGAEAIEAAQAS
jgi:quinol monooxygenase YgiN